MSAPVLLLVAHGTRDPRGVAQARRLAVAVAEREVPVRLAFADVLGPTISQVLRDIGGPVVLVARVLCGWLLRACRTGRVGYVVSAELRVGDAVAQLRADGAQRVIISPYMLAYGVFHTKLGEAGADTVAAPLGVHPLLVQLVLQRYRSVAQQDS